MDFEWDAAKERKNRARHGVSFEEASTLFTSGVDYLEIYDVEHSEEDDRFIAIGLTRRGLLVVVFTEPHEERVRIISARFATAREGRLFGRYMEKSRWSRTSES